MVVVVVVPRIMGHVRQTRTRTLQTRGWAMVVVVPRIIGHAGWTTRVVVKESERKSYVQSMHSFNMYIYI